MYITSDIGAGLDVSRKFAYYHSSVIFHTKIITMYSIRASTMRVARVRMRVIVLISLDIPISKNQASFSWICLQYSFINHFLSTMERACVSQMSWRNRIATHSDGKQFNIPKWEFAFCQYVLFWELRMPETLNMNMEFLLHITFHML